MPVGALWCWDAQIGELTRLGGLRGSEYEPQPTGPDPLLNDRARAPVQRSESRPAAAWQSCRDRYPRCTDIVTDVSKTRSSGEPHITRPDIAIDLPWHDAALTVDTLSPDWSSFVLPLRSRMSSLWVHRTTSSRPDIWTLTRSAGSKSRGRLNYVPNCQAHASSGVGREEQFGASKPGRSTLSSRARRLEKYVDAVPSRVDDVRNSTPHRLTEEADAAPFRPIFVDELSPPPTHEFRADIQGLRAVAVLLTLIWHARFPFLPHGYVGVDAFFVISGFLITGLIIKERAATGRVNLRAFYARRARRLLPASGLVIVVTVGLCVLLVPQIRWPQIRSDALASAFYVENWRLAGQSIDYVLQDASPSPFQHFWSLAVEEQFYLVWPLLIMLCTPKGSLSRGLMTRLLALGIGTVAAASFAWSVVYSARSPGQAYFVTTTRAWEFALGALTALLLNRPERGADGPIRICGPRLAAGAVMVRIGDADRLGGVDADRASVPGIRRPGTDFRNSAGALLWARGRNGRSVGDPWEAATGLHRRHFVLAVPLALAATRHRRSAVGIAEAVAVGGSCGRIGHSRLCRLPIGRNAWASLDMAVVEGGGDPPRPGDRGCLYGHRRSCRVRLGRPGAVVKGAFRRD